ncbi:MAG: hypothetical protein QOD72_1156 [Acidimicrobiaceae bacterium]|nr:hypothetical protein [Acidimicrobiaceae bacterium]
MVTLVLAHQRTPDVGPSDQAAGQHADREATEMCRYAADPLGLS